MAKRIQFRAHGGPEVLEYVDYTPAEPGPQQVRVQNKAIGLNFIDTYFRSGLYAPPALPSGLGAEGAGVVDAVGSEVTQFKVGDRVAYGSGPLGAYSGETILFHAAAGGVGSLACQWAKALGVKLIGTVSSPEKAALAKSLGAWETIDYSKENVAQRVLELTDGKKCPVVYDGVGKDTWLTSLDSVAPRGLVVSFGNASGAVDGVNLGILAAKGSLYVTRPTLATYANNPENLQAMADDLFSMIISGKLQIDINQRFSLGDAAKAQIELSARRTTGSTILLP
eukprot:gene20350-24173_t